VSGVLQIEYGGSLRKLSNKRQFCDSLFSDGHTLLVGVNELLFALSVFGIGGAHVMSLSSCVFSES